MPTPMATESDIRETPFGTAGTAHASATIGVIRGSPEPPTTPPVRFAIELASPVQHRFEEFLATNRASGPIDMVIPDEFRGQTVAICGAGPSLADETIRGVDHIMACNSALPFLMDRGIRVTGAFGIDQSPGLRREWDRTFDLPYYVASSCDPALIAHLRANGRALRWFHNAVGIPDEVAYYTAHWPMPMFMVGRGMTVVSRAVWVARWMGFERIDVYGADCAFAADDQAHANGDSAATAYGAPLIMDCPPGVIGPRGWRTRPDMLYDAVLLVRMVREAKGSLRLMGDTLPVALLGKEDAFLDLVSRSVAPGECAPAAPASFGTIGS